MQSMSFGKTAKLMGTLAITALCTGCYNLAITGAALVFDGIQRSAVDASIRNASGTTPASTVLGPATTGQAGPTGSSARAPKEAQWETYQPQGVPLKVELPGPADVKVHTAPWDGWTMKTTAARALLSDDRSFAVGYGEFPVGYVGNTGAKAILDRRRDTIIRESKAVLRSEQPWSSGQAAGVEVVMTLTDGRVNVGRQVIFGNWLIMQSYIGPPGTEQSPEAVRFLSSFLPGEAPK